MTLLEVIEQISADIRSMPDVHAMWVEGSWATGKNSDESDIDVWLDVGDGTFEMCVEGFRQALQKVGQIDWEKPRGIYSKSPKLFKHTFHLQGFPEPQRIELDLQEHSRNFIFDSQEHTVRVIFDKDGTVRWRE